MNHACVCGHLPRDHYADTGRCEHQDKTLWGEWIPCGCPTYEWQGNE